MTQEPSDQSNPEPSPKVEKLLIDNTTNFPFHAAYMVYSESFDAADDIGREELNRNIQDLQENKIDSQAFYQNIGRYRKLGPMPKQERFQMQTQRKKDWRKQSQRQERIKRHKK
jgi:hypothetical protein